MSELKVNKISPRSGTAVTLGDSGDTFTIPSGATLAIAGTVTGFTSAGIDDNATSVAITISSAEDVTFTEDILLGDSKKALFGAGSDFQMYHDGNNSIITEEGGGNFQLRTNGPSINLQKGNSEDMAVFTADGAVSLYHDNAKKFETTSTGATVTGTTSTSGGFFNTVNNSLLTFGGGNAGNVGSNLTMYGGADGSAGVFRFRNATTINAFITASGQIQGTSGAVSAPTFSFTNDPNTGMSRPTTDAINFVTAGAERLRINSAGLVGIGTSSPTATLHVDSGNSGVTPNGNADDLFIENNGAAGITIGSSVNEKGNIFFADSGNALDGYIQYAHDSRYLRFATATLERMRIDSSGRLLVGKTAIGDDTVGVEIRGDGLGQFTRSGNKVLMLNRKSSDGAIQEFRKDNTKVGTISCDASQNLTIQGNSNSDFSIIFAPNKLNPKNYAGTGAKDNAVDLGDNNDRWKDIYLGGGAFIGGTAAANKLDDYEEGTFTPTWSGSSSVSVASGNYGYYTKIGNVVTVYFGAVLTSTSNSYYSITNAPFQGNIPSGSAMGSAREYGHTGYSYRTIMGDNSNAITMVSYTNNAVANAYLTCELTYRTD